MRVWVGESTSAGGLDERETESNNTCEWGYLPRNKAEILSFYFFGISRNSCLFLFFGDGWRSPSYRGWRNSWWCESVASLFVASVAFGVNFIEEPERANFLFAYNMHIDVKIFNPPRTSGLFAVFRFHTRPMLGPWSDHARIMVTSWSVAFPCSFFARSRKKSLATHKFCCAHFWPQNVR